MDLQSNQKFVDEIRSRMAPEHILLNEPMKDHTTFRIGGPADCLILPASMEDVAFVFQCLKRHDIPFVILGNITSSNTAALLYWTRGFAESSSSLILRFLPFGRRRIHLRQGQVRCSVMYRNLRLKTVFPAWNLPVVYQEA